MTQGSPLGRKSTVRETEKIHTTEEVGRVDCTVKMLGEELNAIKKEEEK